MITLNKLTDDNDEKTASQMDAPKQRVHDFAIPFNDIIEKDIIDAIESAIKKVP